MQKFILNNLEAESIIAVEQAGFNPLQHLPRKYFDRCSKAKYLNLINSDEGSKPAWSLYNDITNAGVRQKTENAIGPGVDLSTMETEMV